MGCHPCISRFDLDLKHHRHRLLTRNCNFWLATGQTAGTETLNRPLPDTIMHVPSA
jgi:hypothetical protein